MVQCQCLKANGQKCTREASTKAGDNPLFCWQHQKCQKSPLIPKVIKEPIPLKVTKKTISQLINYGEFTKIYPEEKIIGQGSFGKVYSSGQFIIKKSEGEDNFDAF